MTPADPLPGQILFRSSDVGEARQRIGEVFCPHRLEPLAGDRRLDVRFQFSRYRNVGLVILSYGGEARISCGPMRSFHAIQIPLDGRVNVKTGNTEIAADRTVAYVPDPDASLDMRLSTGNKHLVVLVDRGALQSHLGKMLGRELGRPLGLAPAMHLTTPAIRSWLETVNLLRADAEGPGILQNPMLRPQFERTLMSQLLLALPNSYSEMLAGGETAPAPRPIRQAEQLIIDHARESLTVEDIAEAVGLSVRSLQAGFRRYLDTTPLERLREARLAGAYAELAAADPASMTVSAVAARWGFWHLGRFSVAYRKRWGVSPSVTLRS
jgi:AraC-like DNA-binding protein